MRFHLPKAALAEREWEKSARRRASRFHSFHVRSPRGTPHRRQLPTVQTPLAHKVTVPLPTLDRITSSPYPWLRDALPQCPEQAGVSTGAGVQAPEMCITPRLCYHFLGRVRLPETLPCAGGRVAGPAAR